MTICKMGPGGGVCVEQTECLKYSEHYLSHREDSVHSLFITRASSEEASLGNPDQPKPSSFQGELSEVISMLIGLLLVST